MNPFATSSAASINPFQWHVLVLHNDSNDLLGIWGPYGSLPVAELALTELKGWPIDGEWSVVALKKFQSTSDGPTTGTFNYRDSVLTNQDYYGDRPDGE